MLEFVEEAFNPVAQLVGVVIVGDLGFSRSVWRDDDVDVDFGKQDAELIGVVAFVRNHADACEAIDQVGLPRI